MNARTTSELVEPPAGALHSPSGDSWSARLITAWGVLSVAALLTRAIVRLAPVALEPLQSGELGAPLLAVYWLWVVAMAYAEGYRGFQRQFAPRVVLRALHLGRHPKALHVALAPFFCVGLLHATRRRLITSWSIFGAVTVAVVAVRALPTPWRGIVDAGVIAGLGWGIGAVLVLWIRALAGYPPAAGSADLPAG